MTFLVWPILALLVEVAATWVALAIHILRRGAAAGRQPLAAPPARA